MAVDPEHYPRLASRQDVVWGATRLQLRFVPEPADPALIGNVRCAAFVDDRVLLIETEEFGLSAFPGGTLEEGESWRTALDRELLEEAGARPLRVEVVGSLRFRTEAPEPYRPYQPHPEFHQVVSFTDVEIVGRPTNPEGGEHVIGVELVPIDDALERLRAENPFEGELLAYVVGCRGQRSDRDGSSL